MYVEDISIVSPTQQNNMTAAGAINLAARATTNLGAQGSVWIPADYIGANWTSNPNNVCIIDMRPSGNQGTFFQGPVSATTLTATGTSTLTNGISSIGGQATSGSFGVPVIVYSTSLAAQAFGIFNTGAAVNMLPIAAPAGTYLATFYLDITTTFQTNTAVTLAFGWTDDSQAQTTTFTGGALTAGTTITGSQLLRSANRVFSLTSVAAGTGVYTGTITNGGSNFYAGSTFVIAGFTNAPNNGTFACTASSTTTLTLTNASSISESATATATTGPAAITYTPAKTGSAATAGAAAFSVILERLI